MTGTGFATSNYPILRRRGCVHRASPTRNDGSCPLIGEFCRRKMGPLNSDVQRVIQSDARDIELLTMVAVSVGWGSSIHSVVRRRERDSDDAEAGHRLREGQRGRARIRPRPGSQSGRSDRGRGDPGELVAHPKANTIFLCSRAIRESADVLVCRLVGGKVTYVHRRLWPALVRLAGRFNADQLAVIEEVHTPSGRHKSQRQNVSGVGSRGSGTGCRTAEG